MAQDTFLEHDPGTCDVCDELRASDEPYRNLPMTMSIDDTEFMLGNRINGCCNHDRLFYTGLNGGVLASFFWSRTRRLWIRFA